MLRFKANFDVGGRGCALEIYDRDGHLFWCMHTHLKVNVYFDTLLLLGTLQIMATDYGLTRFL
jgi:hypothetical protein